MEGGIHVGTILSKKQMSEEDIKLQYITPSITSKWNPVQRLQWKPALQMERLI